MACTHLQRFHLSPRPTTLIFTGIMVLMVAWSGAVFANATLISVKASAIHPTQPAIGKAEVAYDLAHYRQKPRALFDDFCKGEGAGKAADFSDTSTLAIPTSFRCSKPAGTHPEEVKSAVIAPDGQVYLTDGHHSVSALRASTPDADITLSLRITDDLRHLPSMAAFWEYLQQHHLVWLVGPMGNITPQELPAQVGIDTLQDDPYRSVLYFLRGIAYERPASSPPFLEFYLGAWLKGQIAITPADTATSQAYFALLQKAAQLIVLAPSNTHTLPDTASPTLQQLGQLTEVNQKKLNKLSKPEGKLALLYSQR